MPYLLTYFMFKFATLTLSYSMFFGDDAMMTRECFLVVAIIITVRSVLQSVFATSGKN